MTGTASQPTIILLGVGHTNAEVLRRWVTEPIPGYRLICVSPFTQSSYSGMLPAVLAGQMDPAEMQIDLAALANAANAELLTDPVAALDRRTRHLLFEDGRSIHYDLLSIGIGSVPAGLDGLDASPMLLPVKPMQTFLRRLRDRIKACTSADPIRIAIAGGGVAGVEVACCLHRRLRTQSPDHNVQIDLFTGSTSIAGDLCRRSIGRLERHLDQIGVRVHPLMRIESIDSQHLTTTSGKRVRCDVLLWVTGAAPPPLIEQLNLSTDEQGFLATRPTLQTIQDDRIFAVGDCGSIVGRPFAKAGVYAVRQSPILWNNLNAVAKGETLQSFEPQTSFLKLINTGDDRALLDYRGQVFHARWCWRLKRHIDRRFMRRFRC